MQGQGSVLYFQPRTATPSELSFAAAHRERERRIADAARKLLVEVEAPAISLNPEPETPSQWADRQREIHGIKEPWFSIVGEIEAPEPRQPRIEEIQRAVARHYSVSRADMLSARRTANVVRPRQVAMYLSKKLTGRSLPEIGRRTGNRDHTTILHAVNKIEALRERDTDLDGVIIAIEAVLKDAVAPAAMPVE